MSQTYPQKSVVSKTRNVDCGRVLTGDIQGAFENDGMLHQFMLQHGTSSRWFEEALLLCCCGSQVKDRGRHFGKTRVVTHLCDCKKPGMAYLLPVCVQRNARNQMFLESFFDSFKCQVLYRNLDFCWFSTSSNPSYQLNLEFWSG